ncbi:hypothetical protein ACFS07_36040 [Undibacterium arcticum]
MQRDDLTDLETAATLKVLFTKFPELQKQQIAKILKLRNSHISRLLALLDPQWAHVVNSGIITYASLLEQFKSLPEDARNELVSTAKSEERPLTSTDLKKMRAKKITKTKQTERLFALAMTHGPLSRQRQKGKGV